MIKDDKVCFPSLSSILLAVYVSYNNSRGAQSSFLHRVFSPYMYDLKHVCTLRELSGENWMIFGPLLSFKCVHWSLSRGNHNSLSPHVEERSEKIGSLNLSKLKTSCISDFQRISFLLEWLLIGSTNYEILWQGSFV